MGEAPLDMTCSYSGPNSNVCGCLFIQFLRKRHKTASIDCGTASATVITKNKKVIHYNMPIHYREWCKGFVSDVKKFSDLVVG